MPALTTGRSESSRVGDDSGSAGPLGTPPRGAAGCERATGALFAGLLALVASRPISDNSLLTHIATGRLQSGSGLPEVNPFLVTSSDFPVPSWWWSAALGWAERLAGLGAIRVFTVAVAAVLGWLVVRCARPIGMPGSPARGVLPQAFPAALVLVILTPWMNARPHLGGFVLLAVALVVWRERRSPWWMFAIFVVWVNVHGSWLYGIAVLGLLWVAEMLDARRFAGERLRWFVGATGGAVAGGVLYPERFRLLLLPTEQFGDAEARAAIRVYNEWAPAGFSSPWVWVFFMVVGLALYGALSSRITGPARVGSVSAVVVLAGMGLSAMRLLPIAAITLAAFAAEGIAALSKPTEPSAVVRRTIASLGVLALSAAVLWIWRSPHVDLSRYPTEEVDWLAERDLVATDEVRVIHNDWVGNYLEFRFGVEAHAWVDDRPSARTMIDYVRLRGLAEGWREALEGADPDVVLWQAGDPLPAELATLPEWDVALSTDRFQVLCHARIAWRC